MRTATPRFDSQQGKDISLLHKVQTGSGADPASYEGGADKSLAL
jgi:hypothetical protein